MKLLPTFSLYLYANSFVTCRSNESFLQFSSFSDDFVEIWLLIKVLFELLLMVMLLLLFFSIKNTLLVLLQLLTVRASVAAAVAVAVVSSSDDDVEEIEVFICFSTSDSCGNPIEGSAWKITQEEKKRQS